jgi:hypothetical protein
MPFFPAWYVLTNRSFLLIGYLTPKIIMQVKDASAAVNASTARAAELQTQIDDMTAKRLTKFTTVGDVLDQHPEIGEEVEDEIAAMDWKH